MAEQTIIKALRARDVTTLMIACIRARRNLLITGAPGIGKTSLFKFSAQSAKALAYIMHPSISDPTDAKGMPWIYNDSETQSIRAQFVPFDELAEIYNAIAQDLLCSLLLDDLGQATPATQASYMSLMDRVKGKVAIIGATNRRTDRANVQGLLEPVKSRFTTIVELAANADDWCDWAIDNGIRPEVVAFLRLRKDLIHNFNATTDLVNQPCPRTWEAVHNVLELNLPAHIEFQSIVGAVGEGTGAEFTSFLRMLRDRSEVPSLDEILLNPSTAPIPTKANGLYAVSAGLAAMATEQNFGAIATYAQRLYDAKHGEFCVLLIRDCAKRNRQVTRTTTYQNKIARGEIGKLIRGED